MDKKVFGEMLAMLQKYYNKQLDPVIIKVYWSQLMEIDEEEFKTKVDYILRTFVPTATTPFPLLKHFIETNDGMDLHDRAVMAFENLIGAMAKHGFYDSVDFGDPVLHSVILSYGGWREMCTWDKKEFAMRRNQMLDTYMTFFRNGRQHGGHMVGQIEASNSENGFDKFIKPPARIDQAKQKRIN